MTHEQGKYVYTYKVNLESIERLDINWLSGSVSLSPWEEEHVELREYSNVPLTDEQQMALIIKDNCQLAVDWAWKKPRFGMKGKKLVVLIPEKLNKNIEKLRGHAVSGSINVQNLSGENFELSTVSGELTAQNLVAEHLDLGSVSGRLTVKNCSAESMSLHTVSGGMTANSVFAEQAKLSTVSGGLCVHGNAESFKVSTTSGKAWLTVDQCPESAKLSSVSGPLTLTLPKNTDGFTAKFNSMSGGFSTNFSANIQSENKGKKGTVTYGSGATNIKMSTTSGSMKILRAKS